MKKTLLALAFSVFSAYSQSLVTLEISADASGTIPIGVVMFQPTQDSEPFGDAEPWRIIAVDLDFTGDFSVKKLNPDDLKDARKLAEEQVSMYVAGDYHVKGDTMILNAHLYDSGTHKQLYSKTYSFHKNEHRNIAHAFSGEIHKALLGLDGPYESKIAYVERSSDGSKNISVCDYDGQNKRRVTRGGISVMPSFFTDKQTILYVAYDNGKPDIYSINLQSGAKKTIMATRKVESSPNYSDITGRILYASSKGGNMEVYSIDKSIENDQRLTVNPPAISTAPNWSPNGHRIAFVSDRVGSPQIYTMDRTGGDVQRLTFGGTWHDSPSFSPDGSKIAYTAQRNGRNMIAINSVEGEDEELLTVEVIGTQEYPSWSPDGSYIIFTHKHDGRSDIAAIRLKDKRVIKITNSGVAEQSKCSGI
ncbi:MAG: hypothetical protein FWF51_10200 [Chitinivibrionia bacterium]|nr:hypothetical protein [Chitinivibrionia bacterium]